MRLNFRLGRKLGAIFGGKKDLAQLLGEIEELLISADFGLDFTGEITAALKKSASVPQRDALLGELKGILKSSMTLPDNGKRPAGLVAHLIFGVNGSGKTTTAGKLAYKFKKEGRRVLIAAADTYRDAAIEQLLVWAKRADVPLVRQKQGSDPGAVVFDACDAAVAREVDDLIIDTAGRLHTKETLMEELAKIGRVMEKKLPAVRKVKLLTLDATTGQNALSQAKLFNEYIGVDGIILTKLDSSSKGGVACAVSGKLKIPILYIGVGEKIEDLDDFDVEKYLELLFERE